RGAGRGCRRGPTPAGPGLRGAGGFKGGAPPGTPLGGGAHALAPPLDLAWLVDALVEQGRFARIRLSSIDPHEVSEELVRRMAAAPAICPHLHVPLQAGDDGGLARMRRRYDTALAAERLAMGRELLPVAAIGTDLLAGLPGEDGDAFQRTPRFVESSPITYGHVFPSSVRSGTTAAKLSGHLPPATIAARARRLRAACEQKRAGFARRFDGAPAEVLVETTRDPQSGALRGYTRNYLRARLDGPDAWMGQTIPVRLRVAGGALVEADAIAGATCRTRWK